MSGMCRLPDRRALRRGPRHPKPPARSQRRAGGRGQRPASGGAPARQTVRGRLPAGSGQPRVGKAASGAGVGKSRRHSVFREAGPGEDAGGPRPSRTPTRKVGDVLSQASREREETHTNGRGSVRCGLEERVDGGRKHSRFLAGHPVFSFYGRSSRSATICLLGELEQGCLESEPSGSSH